MQQVNIVLLQQLLPHFFNLRKPLYLWGKPSTAKTSIIRQFAQKKAKELGLKYSEDDFGKDIFTLRIITLSQYDSADLRGMPSVVQKGEDTQNWFTRFIATAELPRTGQGILFFDEANKADESLQAPLYQLILEGRISNLPTVKTKDKDGKEIDAFWRCAASNQEQDFSSVHSTTLALLSRFCHLEVKPELEEIIRHFLENEEDERIIAFLQNYPEELFPKVWNEGLLDKKANPFPRQWENASHLIRGSKESRVMSCLVGSCVSPEVATKFMAFCKLASLVNIESLIAKPKEEIAKILKHEEKASILYASITALASRWFKKTKALTPQKVYEILGVLPPDFAVAYLKMIIKKRTQELTGPEFNELIKKLDVYLDE